MSSLADLPEIVGFFSYSREDDEEGTLSALRDAIQRELSAQLGRSKTNFRLWQDQKAIPPGKLWEEEIKTAVEQAVFFIPIVTPRAVNSHYCKFEFESFLARERALGRADLVFPLHYIRIPALENEAQWREDPVLSIIGTRQYVDWRGLRNRDIRDPGLREAIERFCEKIAQALREPWVSPEERRKQQEAEAKRRAEERQAGAARLAKGREQQAEAVRRAEDEKREAEEVAASNLIRVAISYLDFDLALTRAEGCYRADVLSSPAGRATSDFTLPFSELELENVRLFVGRRHFGMQKVKALGMRLYEAIFSGDVEACWRRSLRKAEAKNAGLRLRLHITDAPELSDVPWEYLYNTPINRFLSLSQETPLIRYLDLPDRIRPLPVNSPLGILVMISSPTDYFAINSEEEWLRLNEALAGLIENRHVRLERLADATLSVLQRRLRNNAYHILHFLGNGGFDHETQKGFLVLSDEAGKGRRVAAQQFATILHDHPSLRLVVLNTCEGARTSRADPFAGVAQTLVQQGVSAVIAMQFEISNVAAATFAGEFYAAMADGCSVDTALAEARKAIFAADNNEWGTPVLYLRATNGPLFSVNRDSAFLPRQAEEEKQRAEGARLAEDEKQSAEAAGQERRELESLVGIDAQIEKLTREEEELQNKLTLGHFTNPVEHINVLRYIDSLRAKIDTLRITKITEDQKAP